MTDLKATRDPSAPETSEAGSASGPLLALRLPLSVELGTADLTMGEIINLKPSTVVPLGATDAAPVRLHVNGVLVATGSLLSDGDRLTFRVKSIESDGLDAGTLKAGAPASKGGAP